MSLCADTRSCSLCMTWEPVAIGCGQLDFAVLRGPANMSLAKGPAAADSRCLRSSVRGMSKNLPYGLQWCVTQFRISSDSFLNVFLNCKASCICNPCICAVSAVTYNRESRIPVVLPLFWTCHLLKVFVLQHWTKSSLITLPVTGGCAGIFVCAALAQPMKAGRIVKWWYVIIAKNGKGICKIHFLWQRNINLIHGFYTHTHIYVYI